ncbi:TonB-dependent receptor [Sphingomonas sp. KR1UV-12]|uniref:TonB-dependent receptor n=1 Tax=Sphingomonas aurea TaxID=3063994 RepID=A0ABT9EKS1_9SPHN|nr:TonB-dependent receptor [Sphingomonas sp. KR1UV-12]MDP1027564.1 TonB-dependent receptor [Sphingomonas sp. KR1UV-12]
MRLRTLLAASTALVLALPVMAHAQVANTPDATDTAAPNQAVGPAPQTGDQDIVVTARKRAETLLDVPIAATAISGNTLTERGINSVREAAALTPGLNIASDGAGRAFVSIRGVGVTLVQSVQPGVGLFINGIYQPNTSYLNNPLLDIDRIEVLRGPQGTLYGKNTLGGAINVITRQPSNEVEARGNFSFAGPDDSLLASASVSGPIIRDVLQVRIAAGHRQQDGFARNTLLNINASPFKTDSLNGTIRFAPVGDVVLTVNGYYDWVKGANTPYARVTGPTDYSRSVQFNVPSRIEYRYRGVNARLETPIDAIGSKFTLVGSYDARDGLSPNADADFGPADIARANGTDTLRTKTVEARLDSDITGTVSSLFGLFYSREEATAFDRTRIIPANLTRLTNSANKADTYAAFGTLFWKPTTAWEVALGLRYDHEKRSSDGSVSITAGAVTLPTTFTTAQLKSNQVEPRLSITRHWTPQLMTYASVARGYRGGGFNAPTAPVRQYKGDSAWTYEVGSKYISPNRAFSLSGDVFYNDYSNYIGLNSIAPAAGGGLVTVDLNTGDVESYGAELEATIRPTSNWSINGGATYMHARITDASPYTAVTGRTLSSDRLTFQPDFTGNVYTDYTIPLGGTDTLTLTGGVVAKGKRLAATLNQTTPTFLKGYALVNAAITWRSGPVELAVFANNLFQKDYFDAYIEKTTLALAGLPASDLGIIGDRRRVGVRLGFRF